MPDYQNNSDVGYHHKFYIEQGAGIDILIEPLVALSENKHIKSLLDIGCGYGFTLDFANKMLGWKAIGVEPSSYGRLGAQALGLTIYDNYLEKVRELSESQFDLIISAEVIEHVEKPNEFINLLKKYLSANGILILTTPNASWIEEGQSVSTLMAVLSPGFHANLFSPASLEKLLREAGFKFIEIAKQKSGLEQRLVVYASKQAFKLAINPSEIQNIYLTYLQTSLNRNREKDFLYDGIAYRLFRELINAGQFNKAETILTDYKLSLNSKYGDILNPDCLTETFQKNEKLFSLAELGNLWPYHLAGLYYYLGMMQLNHKRDFLCAAKFFHTAFEISSKFLKIAIAFFAELEDLLWRMKFHEGLAYLYAQEKKKALEIFLFILNAGLRKNSEISVALPPDICVNVLYHAGIAQLQLGNYADAVAWFQKTIQQESQTGTSYRRQDALQHLEMAQTLLKNASTTRGEQTKKSWRHLFRL
jgi:2-polyprenyl-3-methyl-5-hydroxy-6-metoxy-1,4-benzoquinol methylase